MLESSCFWKDSTDILDSAASEYLETLISWCQDMNQHKFGLGSEVEISELENVIGISQNVSVNK
jgi:hypothetical protein